MPKDINLVLAGKTIVPEDAAEGPDRARTADGQSFLRHGDPIRFTVSKELTGLQITFTDASPLEGDKTVPYMTTRKVDSTARLGGYKYDCTATDEHGNAVSSKGGGEVIIIGN